MPNQPSFLAPLEDRYGQSFVMKLKTVLTGGKERSPLPEAWPVGRAKDHLSKVLRLADKGACQVVKRPKGREPVFVISVESLARLVEATEAEAQQRRFIDLFRPNPALPTAGEPLRVEEDASGEEHFTL